MLIYEPKTRIYPKLFVPEYTRLPSSLFPLFRLVLSVFEVSIAGLFTFYVSPRFLSSIIIAFKVESTGLPVLRWSVRVSHRSFRITFPLKHPWPKRGSAKVIWMIRQGSSSFQRKRDFLAMFTKVIRLQGQLLETEFSPHRLLDRPLCGFLPKFQIDARWEPSPISRSSGDTRRMRTLENFRNLFSHGYAITLFR